MQVTDKEMAEVLGKTVVEIEALKKSNEDEYKVLKTGVLCKKLNLNSADLQKMFDMKVDTKVS